MNWEAYFPMPNDRNRERLLSILGSYYNKENDSGVLKLYTEVINLIPEEILSCIIPDKVFIGSDLIGYTLDFYVNGESIYYIEYSGYGRRVKLKKLIEDYIWTSEINYFVGDIKGFVDDVIKILKDDGRFSF